MPAAVVAPVVGYVASEAATAVIGTELLGSTILADAATGAITGGAVSAATGGDIGKGVLFGGVGGVVGGEVGRTAASAAKDVGASAQTAADIGKAAGTIARGTTTGVLSGQDLGTALGRSAIQAGGGYLASQVIPGTDTTSKIERGLLSSGVTQGLTSVLGLDKTQAPTQVASSYVPSTTTTTGQAGTTPGTQALGQALRIDPTATLGGGDQTKPSENVWNVASLRVKDETGA